MFNIYIGNHPTTEMIDDYISMFKHILHVRKIPYKVSSGLCCDSVNLVVDEFSDQARIHELTVFKREHRESVVILVLTEFIEQGFFVNSLNYFDKTIKGSSIISALKVYYVLKKSAGGLSLTISEIIFSLIYIPVSAGYYLVDIIKSAGKSKKIFYWEEPRKYGYWVKRYLGLRAAIKYFDGVVLSHDLIKLDKSLGNANILGSIYPEFDINKIKGDLFYKKRLFFEVTGTLTSYRKWFIEEIDNDIRSLCLGDSFDNSKAIRVSSEERGSHVRGAYSVHPPQTETWKYSSPTRIYRALYHDNNFPVLTKNFKQHPIEDICIVYEKKMLPLMIIYYERKELFLDLVNDRLISYLLLAGDNNDKVIKKIGCDEGRA